MRINGFQPSSNLTFSMSQRTTGFPCKSIPTKTQDHFDYNLKEVIFCTQETKTKKGLQGKTSILYNLTIIPHCKCSDHCILVI